MPNLPNVAANIPLVKKSYKAFVALGECVTGNEFTMKIEGYPELTYLVSSVQLPAIQREMVELYGPHGVKFMQQGRFVNAQDIPITFEEVISGLMYKALREWVREKKYLQVTLALVSESMPVSSPFATVVCEDCWIELEGVDMSKEDGAAAIKPSGTLHANWVGWLDDDTITANFG